MRQGMNRFEVPKDYTDQQIKELILNIKAQNPDLFPRPQ